jgi:predicted metal-binding protein
MGVTLHVCITCKAGQAVPEGQVEPGARLHAALAAAAADAVTEGVSIQPVACLSACNTGCAVALSGPGRWSYVYGFMDESHAAEILRGAALYARAPDGIVVWRDRPAIFRKQSVARVPPQKGPNDD